MCPCLQCWGNPAVAECFCDQTLLTPTVDNLGNSSSSLRLELNIAMKVVVEGGVRRGFFWALGQARWWRGLEGSTRSRVRSEMGELLLPVISSRSISTTRGITQSFLSPCSSLATHPNGFTSSSFSSAAFQLSSSSHPLLHFHWS